MIAIWPETLPQSPLIEGYSRSPVESRLISTVDAGARKIRNRFLAVPENTTEIFMMDAQQLAAFRVFFEDEIKRGAERFIKKDPSDGQEKEYRFRSPYSEDPAGPFLTRVTCQLEIMP
ncbi:hypothetical protein M316_0120 [Nitrincola phage 1M3-16]|uniref:hypothetical protein n=1 Tax=Nitrincola phage 1M3-16 TaxID=1472912 RepID=UPI000444CBFD|nr:hypothetical protein GJ22_gp032 [Nitrincola phage 1M3-16]AHX01185.1 hypothetical protein M316_0120 [Nitrincola phage 1M3-16]